MPSAIPQTQMRLGPECLAELDRIATHLGLRSRTDAVRYAAKYVAARLDEAPEKTIKKPAKRVDK